MELEDLYADLKPRLLQLTCRYGLVREQGEEIVQEVFTKFLLKQPDISSEKTPSYLVVMTKNACLDLVRRQARFQVESHGHDFEIERASSLWPEDLQRKNLLELVHQLGNEMADLKGGEEFCAYYFGGESLRSIAQKNNEAGGTVHARVHRFRTRFKEHFRKKLMASDDVNCSCL